MVIALELRGKPGGPLAHEKLLDGKLPDDFLEFGPDLFNEGLAVLLAADALEDLLDPQPQLGVLAGDEELVDLGNFEVPLLDLV